MMTKSLRLASPRLLLGIILSIHTLLAVGYSLTVPLFEAPDEQLHFFTVDAIIRERRLPVASFASQARQEAAQPPLYYLLGALLVAPINSDGTAEQLWLNPLADPGNERGDADADPPLNINAFVHTAAEAWPWRGHVLAAHLLRFLSTLIGVGTLLVIYGCGRLLWLQRPGNALLATALIAFLPQYAFLHGAITNDPLIIFFATLALYQLLRMVNGQWLTVNGQLSIANSQFIILGLIIGLAMLSKTAGLLLLVFVGGYVFVLMWLPARELKGLGRALGAAALVVIPALLVAGWWLWRNWLLYGDVTAASQFVALAGGERPFTLRQVWGEMDRVLFSTFAYFGWMNVRAPQWVYVGWGGVVIVAGLGWLWRIVEEQRGRGAGEQGSGGAEGQRSRGIGEQRGWRGWLLGFVGHPGVMLGGWFLLVFVGWLQFMLRTPADQGRLLFPALLAMTAAVTGGLARWPRPWTQVAAVLFALLTSVYCLFGVVRAAYAVPPTVSALPAEATALEVEMAPGLELVGAQIETTAARPNEWAWVTLYWRSSAMYVEEDAPIVQLDLFGRGFHLAGRQLAYHGRGLYPLPLWPLEQIIAERAAVRLYPWAETPGRGRLAVSLVTAEGEPWPQANGEGEGISIGEIKLQPSRWPEVEGEVMARFGEGIELVESEITPLQVAPGEAVEVGLRWRVTAAPQVHLHTFVHLGDPTQAPLAQHDGPPLGDEYPTWLWEAGEVIEDRATLLLPSDLPPGQYPLHAGFYAPDSGTRLPLFVEGERQLLDALQIGFVTVE